MPFDAKYFRKFKFTPEQVAKNLENAFKDLKIAKEVDIPDVRFNYAYTALIKTGIALLSYYQIKQTGSNETKKSCIFSTTKY